MISCLRIIRQYEVCRPLSRPSPLLILSQSAFLKQLLEPKVSEEFSHFREIAVLVVVLFNYTLYNTFFAFDLKPINS